jgi:hypothetical protein
MDPPLLNSIVPACGSFNGLVVRGHSGDLGKGKADSTAYFSSTTVMPATRRSPFNVQVPTLRLSVSCALSGIDTIALAPQPIAAQRRDGKPAGHEGGPRTRTGD